MVLSAAKKSTLPSLLFSTGGQYPVSCAVASALATGFLVAIRLVECQVSHAVLDLLCIAELRASCCTVMVSMSQCACDCQQFTLS